MSNELSKAIKRKTDAQFRTMGEDRTPSISEGAGGSVIILDPGQYQIPYVAGKNVTIGTSGNNKVINALMNILAGQNITVGEPDPDTGAVTISSNIGGKAIDLSGLADGYVLKYDLASDSFVLGEGGGISEVPQATETDTGGIKAAERTTESSEVKIDPATGKLYVNAPDEAANGIPAGGTAGQILSKVDGTDYNAEWVNNLSTNPVGQLVALPSYIDGSLSGSAYAWKGNMFKPELEYKLHAIGYIGNIISSGVYQAAVITKNASNTIETIIKSASVQLPSPITQTSTKCLWLKFSTPVRLEVGSTYYLMVGRTDSTDNYSLPIPFSGGTSSPNSVPMVGLSHGNSALIAKANPAVGDAMTLATANSAGQFFLYEQI